MYYSIFTDKKKEEPKKTTNQAIFKTIRDFFLKKTFSLNGCDAFLG